MIIAMAGLPGTGKSALANVLAEKLPAVVLNKDSIRAALFPAGEIDHSSYQDDFVMDVMFQVAEYYFQKNSKTHVIFDGRTFSRRNQVDALVKFSLENKRDLRTIYCECSNEIAQTRIERDLEKKEHLASDRDFNLYLRLQSQSEPLQVPHISIETGEPFEKCVLQCLDYLNQPIRNLEEKNE